MGLRSLPLSKLEYNLPGRLNWFLNNTGGLAFLLPVFRPLVPIPREEGQRVQRNFVDSWYNQGRRQQDVDYGVVERVDFLK